MTRAVPRTALTVLLATSLALPLAAQWSTDPAANLALADRSGEQTQPKVAPTSDGGAYVSWFDNSSGGYDVTLQRIDLQGNEQWAHDGVLIANRSFSSTQDYGLDVDAAGNALLAFRDDRVGGVQITAAKVDPSGNQVWGATGVQLTATAAFVAAPKIAGTSDGGCVVAWTQDASTVLQKLDASGVPQWGVGVTLVPGAGSYSASDLHGAGSNDVVLSFVHQTGGFGSPRHLLAQKLDGTGALLWGAGHVAVFDGGSLQLGNFPTFVPDGAGGGVFAWYSVSPLQCRVQRVLGSGTEAFAHDGVAVSTNLLRVRTSPSVDFSPSSGETFVSWIEQDSLQSQHGVYAQKLDASGVPQWGAEGQVLVPVAAGEKTQARTVAHAPGAFVFWVDSSAGFGQAQVVASRLDGAGGFAFAPFAASSLLASKSRLVAAHSTVPEVILAWVDGRDDSGDVYAQNVQPDGSLGPVVIPTLPEAAVLLLAGLLALGGVRSLRARAARPA